MGKVSILTFHYSNNIGAMLQAYGLSKTIESMGHEVEVIDYRPSSIRSACERPLPRHPMKLLDTLIFRHRIRNFRKKFLSLSRTYLEAEELKQYPPETDCIVCGSDQVWNTRSPVRGYDPTFFLDFLDDNGPRRVSYAASFGNGTELGCHRDTVSELLSRFDRISVRDSTSRKMVMSLIDRKPEHVLDPCFLSDYDSITPSRIIKKPYVLIYCFQKNDLAEKAIQTLQENLNIAVVSIKLHFKNTKVFNPGPLQWLSLMKYASFVCTDSFHGTCFSLINRKQFITLPFEGGMSRLVDILKTVKLSDRLVHNKNELKCSLDKQIDYDIASVAVNKAREFSLSYLCDALKI